MQRVAGQGPIRTFRQPLVLRAVLPPVLVPAVAPVRAGQAQQIAVAEEAAVAVTEFQAAQAGQAAQASSSSAIAAVNAHPVETLPSQAATPSTRSRLAAHLRFTPDDPLQPRHPSRPCLA